MATRIFQKSLHCLENKIKAEFDLEVSPDSDEGAYRILHGYVRNLGTRVGSFDEAYFHGEKGLLFNHDDFGRPANEKAAIFTAGIFAPIQEPAPIEGEGFTQSVERTLKKMLSQDQERNMSSN